METCPNEILSLIFAEACTDDGLTGRLLSLVSRRIRRVSRTYAFRSVTLYGHHQISAFASLLDREDLKDLHVCHLYLTDCRRVLMEHPPGQDRKQWLKDRIAEDVHTNGIRHISSPSAILHILRTVGPTLQALALLLFNRYDEPILSNALHVPELHELTIHSSTLFRTTCIGPPPLPQCPRLHRLHIIQDFLLGRALAKHVSCISPYLTHLRLSGILPSTALSEDGMVQDLERMIQPEDFAGDIPSTPRFPPTLEQVFIQMANRMPLGPMKTRLKGIAMRDARGWIMLLKTAKRVQGAMLFEASMDVPFYMDIRAGWDGRVRGAESAIWAVDPSAILASYEYSAEREHW